MPRSSHHRPRSIGLLACIGVVVGGLLLSACQPVVVVTVSDPGQSAAVNRLVVGISHTESTIGTVTAAEPRLVELGVLADIPLQNVFLMGWGTANPEPWPGQFDWATLDERVAAVELAGAEPVITLCCAPDWMKGGPPGTTDWDLLTVAPDPANFDDFAALAAATAARYPQVSRFQVWNEMKGFYDLSTNAWDSAAYTSLYNTVYQAVKAVRPDALVGGPYAPIDLWSDPDTMSHPSDVRGAWGVVDQRPLDVLEYWLDHKVGADFVTLDGWITTRDAGLVTDPFTATSVFGELTSWLRDRTDLPIWWSEVHVADPSWPLALQDAATTSALIQMAQAGASVALLWSPQATDGECGGCLWSDPASGPVVPTPLAASVRSWARCAPLGSRWLDMATSDGDLVGAAATENGAYLLSRSAAATVALGTTAIELDPNEVAVVGTGSSCHR